MAVPRYNSPPTGHAGEDLTVKLFKVKPAFDH